MPSIFLGGFILNMNKKKMGLLTIVALAALLLGAGPGRAGPSDRLTMLVVPARYSVMQVAFDLAARYPVVLVSYQGDASSETPLLHAWNGNEWVKISPDDYAQASFLQYTPGAAVLIGDEKLLPPILASSIASWCPKVDRIPSIDTADLVNSCASIFGFSEDDWQWFAKRYNLTLTDHNAEIRNKSWYDRPSYEDHWTPKLENVFRRVSKTPEPEVSVPPATISTETQTPPPATAAEPVVQAPPATQPEPAVQPAPQTETPPPTVQPAVVQPAPQVQTPPPAVEPPAPPAPNVEPQPATP